MSQVLRWETPPSKGALAWAAQWQGVAEQLRANPGEWAVIEELPAASSGLPARVKVGEGPFAPAGAFETTCRSRPETPHGPAAVVVYARYVGEGGAIDD